MKKKIENIAYKCTFPYILIYLFYVCINDILFFINLLNPINKLIYPMFAIAGAILIIIDFFGQRRMLKAKGSLFLVLFVIFTGISSLINARYGFVENVKTIVWTAILFFVIYSFTQMQSKTDSIKQLKIISNTITPIYFGGVIVSFMQFVFQINYNVLSLDSGKSMRQGFTEGRLFGVFYDPNYSGITCLCMIALSVFFILNSKNILLKIYHWVNIVFQILYVVLCASRTAQLAALIALIICIPYPLYRFLRNKQKIRFVSFIIALSVAVGCCVVVVYGTQLIREGASYLPSLIGVTQKNPTGTEKPGNNHQVIMTRPDTGTESEISNHRIEIWLGGLEIWKSTPFFGTSPRNNLIYAKEVMPDSFIAKSGYSMHNGYLNVLVSTGFFGAISFIGFVVMYLCCVIKRFLTATKSTDFSKPAVLLSILICCSLGAMSLQMLIFMNSIREVFFWTILGYMLSLMPGDTTDEKQPVLYRLSESLISHLKKERNI
ncbi:MAG: hypothetical protein DBX47_06145 [Clostridiales bacterium]|nr:MAG: hypothetical protein DBX47_06145 [Clostridiales bacterium]